MAPGIRLYLPAFTKNTLLTESGSGKLSKMLFYCGAIFLLD